MDCHGCRFEPHAQVLRTTQTLLIRNLNLIGDSAKIDTLSNPPINIVIPIGGLEARTRRIRNQTRRERPGRRAARAGLVRHVVAGCCSH